MKRFRVPERRIIQAAPGRDVEFVLVGALDLNATCEQLICSNQRGGFHMFNGGLMTFFWYMFVFYIFFLVCWMFIRVFADIFGRENLSGWGKAAWIILIFIIPFLGILIYVIVRPKNTEQDKRMMAEAQSTQARVEGGSALDDIAKAQALLDKNAITQTEFESIKAKALAQ